MSDYEGKGRGMFSRLLEASIFGLGMLHAILKHPADEATAQPQEQKLLAAESQPGIPITSHRLMRNKFHIREGWHEPMPHTLPAPTYAPVTLAFGIVFVAFGLISEWYFCALGGVIMLIALWAWVMELVND